MSDQDDDDRTGVLATLRRWRALIVLVPLLAGLVVVAGLGARMLWADPPDRSLPPEVTCWNGTVERQGDCPTPAGVPGLRWVFPSFDPRGDDCARIPGVGADAPPLQWGCRLPIDGEEVRVVYSVRSAVEQMHNALAGRYGEPRRVADGERLVYRLDERTDEGYVLAAAYADQPYAVTVTAATIGLRDRALTRLVRFRPAERVVERGLAPR
jgi:hypothetical protein